MPSSQHSGNRATYTTGVHIHKQQLPWQTGVRDRHGGLSCDHLSIGSECKALTAYSIVRCEDQGRCGGGCHLHCPSGPRSGSARTPQLSPRFRWLTSPQTELVSPVLPQLIPLVGTAQAVCTSHSSHTLGPIEPASSCRCDPV